MNKWYVVENNSCLTAESVLLEEYGGHIYERHITNYGGKSWKVSGELFFVNGHTTELFEKFKERNPGVVKEITEAEAFTILL